MLKKRVSFFDSEEGVQIRQRLLHMMHDSAYNTEPSHSADITQYPNNLIPFVDKHMNYLNAHPAIDPIHYLSNLRLMTKIR